VDGVAAIPGKVSASWTPGWLRFPVLLGEHRVVDLQALRRLGVERGYPATLA
jgi:hypothetical protein